MPEIKAVFHCMFQLAESLVTELLLSPVCKIPCRVQVFVFTIRNLRDSSYSLTAIRTELYESMFLNFVNVYQPLMVLEVGQLQRHRFGLSVPRVLHFRASLTQLQQMLSLILYYSRVSWPGLVLCLLQVNSVFVPSLLDGACLPLNFRQLVSG